jgi:hypothetical protein
MVFQPQNQGKQLCKKRKYHFSAPGAYSRQPSESDDNPENVQDVISAFYYARCIDITGAKPGKEYPVPFMLDDSVYQSKIRFVGRETVKTRLGKINCLIIKPMVATGYVFDDPYP